MEHLRRQRRDAHLDIVFRTELQITLDAPAKQRDCESAGNGGSDQGSGRRARNDDSFVIMARTDALAAEGLDAALERAVRCVEAGADMVSPRR